MSSTAPTVSVAPIQVWKWLGARDDLLWNFACFWLAFIPAGVLWFTRNGEHRG
ncbi:MAG: hypothetical protein R3C68_00130 [Myxococcota bacterium]